MASQSFLGVRLKFRQAWEPKCGYQAVADCSVRRSSARRDCARCMV